MMIDLARKYPPSPSCTCEVCVGYCQRPGWWTVAEAARVLSSGYSHRMMLELAPDRSFGVLSPAFYGCEGGFALDEPAWRGCNFLKAARCELYGAGLMPLECRVCCHDRPGIGPQCHAELEQEWHGQTGRRLVARWCRLTGVWDLLDFYGLGRLKR